eukprot:scaffold5469_cov54-Attheya_sp.AAC.7
MPVQNRLVQKLKLYDSRLVATTYTINRKEIIVGRLSDTIEKCEVDFSCFELSVHFPTANLVG